MTKALLYGQIGFDVESKDVVEWLEDHKDESVELHINSPGGSVFEAIAIRAAILAHKDITIVVDAMAASAAAIISLCGKKLKMAEYSRLMLHSASSFAIGNKKQIQEEVAMLESIDNDLASMIADKFGKPKEEILAEYFDGKDHWLDRDECIEKGLAEKYEEEPEEDGKQVQNKLKLVWDCINFKKQGKTENKTNQNTETMNLDKFKAVSAFKECDSEEAVLNASVKLSEDLATANNSITEKDAQIAEKDAKIAELENKVAEFEAEKKKAQDEADEKVISDAIKAEKITDEQAEIFRVMIKNDRENTLKMIDAMKAPAKPKDVKEFLNGGSGEKKSFFEEEMERIANNTK